MLEITSDPLDLNINTDKLLRTIATNSLALISTRIQQKGENSSGTKMISSSSPRTGSYSKYWGDKREKKGRQVSYIDLTYNADMMNALSYSPVNAQEYELGFIDQKSGIIADGNEEKFGTIFELSDAEDKLIEQVTSQFVDEHFS